MKHWWSIRKHACILVFWCGVFPCLKAHTRDEIQWLYPIINSLRILHEFENVELTVLDTFQHLYASFPRIQINWQTTQAQSSSIISQCPISNQYCRPCKAHKACRFKHSARSPIYNASRVTLLLSLKVFVKTIKLSLSQIDL